MSDIITLRQFEIDAKEGKHDTDYILNCLCQIAGTFTVYESMKNGEYTLIVNDEKGKEMFNATTLSKERINLVYIFLDYFLKCRESDNKPVLSLVH